MTSMTQDLKKFKEFFLDISGLLITFEILSHYPKIDSSYWQSVFQKDVQWITEKFFREKFIVSNGFDLLFSHFSTEYFVFSYFCCCFHSHKICCDVLLITYAWLTSPYSYWSIFLYYWLLLNSYYIIRILYTLAKYYSNPIGLEETFSGSQIKFSEKS